jgi:protein-L-isoaspartate(D-aspartate) O-methyltransferase
MLPAAPFFHAAFPLATLLCGAAAWQFSTMPAAAQSRTQFDQLRAEMVREVVIGAGVTDERVVRSMQATPRHEFVSANVRAQAYFDMALPIGEAQTISSPFIVAYMTQSIDPQPADVVLEIGTGSGYQAAVLSPLVKEVYTIEIVESLGQKAQRTLKRLGYDNVHAKVGDGFLGWPEHAPFDKIIVTCSPEKVPKPLIDQLKEGGLMVIPVGDRYQQTLYLLRKKEGKLEFEKLQPTLFVPMTGKAEETRVGTPGPLQVVNGDFETALGEDGYVPGWYYHRQVEWVEDPLAPNGGRFARWWFRPASSIATFAPAPVATNCR